MFHSSYASLKINFLLKFMTQIETRKIFQNEQPKYIKISAKHNKYLSRLIFSIYFVKSSDQQNKNRHKVQF